LGKTGRTVKEKGEEKMILAKGKIAKKAI